MVFPKDIASYDIVELEKHRYNTLGNKFYGWC